MNCLNGMPRSSNSQPIDFITVTYGNMFSSIRRTIESVYRHTEKPFRIFIVNNGSTDETATYFKKYAECVTVNLSENVGMVKGFNAAVKKADAAYIVRMDHDIELTMPWQRKFINIFENNPKVGIVGPRVIMPGKKIYSADFDFYIKKLPFIRFKNLLVLPKAIRRLTHWTWSANHGEEDNDDRFGSVKEVAHVTGAFFMIKKYAFEKVGEFDEAYMEKNGTFEDFDYTLRMISNGFKVIYDGEIKVLHYCDRPTQYIKQDPVNLPCTNRMQFRQKWGI